MAARPPSVRSMFGGREDVVVATTSGGTGLEGAYGDRWAPPTRRTIPSRTSTGETTRHDWGRAGRPVWVRQAATPPANAGDGCIWSSSVTSPRFRTSQRPSTSTAATSRRPPTRLPRVRSARARSSATAAGPRPPGASMTPRRPRTFDGSGLPPKLRPPVHAYRPNSSSVWSAVHPQPSRDLRQGTGPPCHCHAACIPSPCTAAASR